MKEKRKMIQLTKYARPGEKIKSQYGTITMVEWLNKESMRITSDRTRFAEIMRNEKKDKVALFVNRVA